MQTCQAYQACPVCTHAFSKPLTRGVVADGYRSFLPSRSAGRARRVRYKGHIYEYKDVERRPKPKYRSTEFVKQVLSIATSKNPVLGHKTAPLLCRWPGFDWRRVICTPEAMHGIFFLFIFGNVMFFFYLI